MRNRFNRIKWGAFLAAIPVCFIFWIVDAKSAYTDNMSGYPTTGVDPIAAGGYVLYASSQQYEAGAQHTSGQVPYSQTLGPACRPGYKACIQTQLIQNDSLKSSSSGWCSIDQIILQPSIVNNGSGGNQTYTVNISTFVLTGEDAVPSSCWNRGIWFYFTVLCLPQNQAQTGSGNLCA